MSISSTNAIFAQNGLIQKKLAELTNYFIIFVWFQVVAQESQRYNSGIRLINSEKTYMNDTWQKENQHATTAI